MVVPNSVQLVNYTTLNLRHNLLSQVNFSVLKEQLPNLKMVDLRDNPFDCKGFPDKTIFGAIIDCEIAVTMPIMPVIILCLKGVVKLCKTRHRTRTLPISCELSLFNFDADSEEHVIFDVTTL